MDYTRVYKFSWNRPNEADSNFFFDIKGILVSFGRHSSKIAGTNMP